MYDDLFKYHKFLPWVILHGLVCVASVFAAPIAANEEASEVPGPCSVESLAAGLVDSCEESISMPAEVLPALESYCIAEEQCPTIAPCKWKCPAFCVCAGHTFGKGIGYPTGYSSIRFLAHSGGGGGIDVQPFLDIRGHILDNGEKAANIGIGARVYNSDLTVAFGTNVYYDYRQGRHVDYSQIGIGAEILGRFCDFRINGYIPVGTRQGITSRLYNHYIGDYFAFCQHNENSLAGFDVELGGCLRRKKACRPCDFNLYGAIGSYYFSTFCGSDIWGGVLRFEAQWLNCLNIEVVAAYDPVFHETLQGIVELCIPLGGGGNFWNNLCSSNKGDCCQKDFCCRRVRRREIIATGHSCSWRTNYESSSGSGRCRMCR